MNLIQKSVGCEDKILISFPLDNSSPHTIIRLLVNL